MFRDRHSQIFFKIIVLKKFVNFTGKHLCRILLYKAAGPLNPNFIKKRLQHRFFPTKFAKFVRTACFTSLASLRFPACNFFKKETPAEMLFCEFCKIFNNIFWQNTSRWLPLVFTWESWKIFQNTCFIEHLWETAYFMYKLQNFNHQIQ